MVFNATCNDISVLLVEEIRRPGETTDLSQVTDKFYHIMLYLIEIRTHNICKSSYHTIMATTAPLTQLKP